MDTNKLKRKQLGKGCNILSVVRKLLSEPKTGLNLKKNSYQFPGILPSATSQPLWYNKNISNLQQSCDNHHFIWKDIQLSKGQPNNDGLINVNISGENKEVFV